MRREKSCGIIVYRKQNDIIELLLIKHRTGGQWSFPKGHMEQGESETQTALREVWEETGVKASIIDGFRECVYYNPWPNVSKKVVYFIGTTDQSELKRQEEEVSEIKWVELDEAERLVTFENDRNLVKSAREFINKK